MKTHFDMLPPMRDIYLRAILDLYNRRIVSFVISERNETLLVFKTFDKAVKTNPGAHPLFHSDRGFHYTYRNFHHKLKNKGHPAFYQSA